MLKFSNPIKLVDYEINRSNKIKTKLVSNNIKMVKMERLSLNKNKMRITRNFIFKSIHNTKDSLKKV